MKTKKLVLTAFFITLGTIIPQLFHLFGLVSGQVFLPMHLPVMIGASLLGMPYAIILGFLTPVVSSLITGMPPLFPIGLLMCIELSVYGAIIAVTIKHWNIYISLISAMLCGRIVNGIFNAMIAGFGFSSFAIKTYLTTVLITALPGIILQLIIVPLCYYLLRSHPLFKQDNIHK